MSSKPRWLPYHLAIDALTNEKVIHDTDKIKYYSVMIKEENKRMNKQVEKNTTGRTYRAAGYNAEPAGDRRPSNDH